MNLDNDNLSNYNDSFSCGNDNLSVTYETGKIHNDSFSCGNNNLSVTYDTWNVHNHSFSCGYDSFNFVGLLISD
ncbi:hypothetical protein [Nostoc sp. LPT]|uniref:hypothetical protein n=1 Tax=Nostoc sp. LPT TaxID=2815387 RepID=UPI001DC1FFEA|nr:hypothetical protein [Nostoc sp. LPT]MBN4001436.1 hypothetical protein [Nostoc sp. LPT]